MAEAGAILIVAINTLGWRVLQGIPGEILGVNPGEPSPLRWIPEHPSCGEGSGAVGHSARKALGQINLNGAT